jgi:predicted transcriptional regulator
MKRTTIFIEEGAERELQALARRQGRPVASLVREAVAQYVVKARAEQAPRLRFIAAGRSGRDDVAGRHEDLLFQADPATPEPRPTRTRTAARARRTRRPT